MILSGRDVWVADGRAAARPVVYMRGRESFQLRIWPGVLCIFDCVVHGKWEVVCLFVCTSESRMFVGCGCMRGKGLWITLWISPRNQGSCWDDAIQSLCLVYIVVCIDCIEGRVSETSVKKKSGLIMSASKLVLPRDAGARVRDTASLFSCQVLRSIVGRWIGDRCLARRLSTALPSGSLSALIRRSSESRLIVTSMAAST